MNKLFRFIGLLWLVGFSIAAKADGIWVLCDHCHQEADFAEVALNAPHQGLVFVSNRNSGATRKFSRVLRWDSASNAWTPQAAPRALSDHENQVFAATIEGGNTVVVSNARNSDGVTRWGLGTAHSVVDDLSNGMLSPALLQAKQLAEKDRAADNRGCPPHESIDLPLLRRTAVSRAIGSDLRSTRGRMQQNPAKM